MYWTLAMPKLSDLGIFSSTAEVSGFLELPD
jgi:hypothetical protein